MQNLQHIATGYAPVLIDPAEKANYLSVVQKAQIAVPGSGDRTDFVAYMVGLECRALSDISSRWRSYMGRSLSKTNPSNYSKNGVRTRKLDGRGSCYGPRFGTFSVPILSIILTQRYFKVRYGSWHFGTREIAYIGALLVLRRGNTLRGTGSRLSGVSAACGAIAAVQHNYSSSRRHCTSAAPSSSAATAQPQAYNASGGSELELSENSESGLR